MHRYRIVNTLSAILDQVGTSCNRPFGVQAQVIPTAWFLLMKKQLIHHGTAKIRFFHGLQVTLSPWGPLFLSRGGPGTPQGKILVRTLYVGHPTATQSVTVITDVICRNWLTKRLRARKEIKRKRLDKSMCMFWPNLFFCGNANKFFACLHLSLNYLYITNEFDKFMQRHHCVWWFMEKKLWNHRPTACDPTALLVPPHFKWLTETQVMFSFSNYKKPLCTWGSCFTNAMGATTEFNMSDRVCLASSGTIGSRPGLSCRPRIVAGWLPVPLPLKETFFSSSVFSVLAAFSPYQMRHVINITVKPVLSRTHIKQTHSIKLTPHRVPTFYSHIYCQNKPAFSILLC